MKLKDHFRRIPRPVKACVCAAGVLILAVVYYIVLGCPTLSFRQEFRRAEKANLVGPSEIVDTLDHEYRDFERLIVGETEHGICFFGRYGTNYSGGKHSGTRLYAFTYREKTSDVTVAAAPNIWGAHWGWGVLNPEASLPVYLFAESPDAVRAELEVTVQGTYTETGGEENVPVSFRTSFAGEAERSDTGIFRFHFLGEDNDAIKALYYLSSITSGDRIVTTQIQESTVLATVRLYDADGELILEKEIDISPNAQ